MSSGDPTPTTGPPNNGPSGPPGGGRGGDNQMSNLYLYTFLATLLLLLAISMLIVTRSVFIRRRARRMMEEAMRNGALPPQTVRSTVKLGAKPKIFDVYTTRHKSPGRSPPDDSLLTWATLKPLSATFRKPVPPSPQPMPPQPTTSTEPPPSLLLRLVPQLRPVSQSIAPDPHAYPLETREPPRDPTLIISVMISMPTPSPADPHKSSRDTFPPVMVGVTHLSIPQGWTMDAKSESG